MSQQDDLLKNLRQTLSEQGIESFHVLEDLVPIEEQMEYFRYFDRLRRENSPFVRDEEIAEILAADLTLDAKCQRLVGLANERGGRDNISVVIVKAHEPPKKSGMMAKLLRK